MSSWLVWMILSRITGSPIGSAVALLVFSFVVDRYTLGVLPDPFGFVSRWRRRNRLRTLIAQNPHDGPSRLELARALIDLKDGKGAVEVLKPNLERGADDVQHVFTMGEACLLAGYTEQGEKLLAHAEELDADFRVGEINRVRGRARLARKDWAGAKQALEVFVKQRGGTVEGRVMLAQALRGLGDDANAALLDDEAWKEHTLSPRFQQRQERLWAWRARPSRPALYAACLVAALAVFALVVAPQVQAAAERARENDDAYGP